MCKFIIGWYGDNPIYLIDVSLSKSWIENPKTVYGVSPPRNIGTDLGLNSAATIVSRVSASEFFGHKF